MNKPELVIFDDMPDIASAELKEPQGTLNWVGMGAIHQPLLIKDGIIKEGGEIRQVQAKVDVYVDLADTHAKGIHMSRLYLILDEHCESRPLTVPGLKLLLASLLQSHKDISGRARVQFDFDYYLRRPALISEYSGWNAYPASIKGTLVDGEVVIELALGVFYSSTCPCSAALARQLIQEQFDKDFPPGSVRASEVRAWLGSDQGIVATPHSQRSLAKFLFRLDDTLVDFPIAKLVDLVEGLLKTPVQTAVKREDEQEFARLNGQNLMFIEDAGRKLKLGLADEKSISDFWVRIEHYESLHAHDAVGVFTKGVKNGYQPIP